MQPAFTVAGFGFGLIYLPSIVSVSYYFEKRRALATGLAVCGSGLGSMIFGPITQALLQNYGWQNTLTLLSGIVLHCAVFGALMRPLEPEVRLEQVRPRAKSFVDRLVLVLAGWP